MKDNNWIFERIPRDIDPDNNVALWALISLQTGHQIYVVKFSNTKLFAITHSATGLYLYKGSERQVKTKFKSLARKVLGRQFKSSDFK